MNEAKLEKDVETIKTMCAYIINMMVKTNRPWNFKNERRAIIAGFEPPLEQKPILCDEDKGERTQRILKAIKKELDKAEIVEMDAEQKKALAARMAAVIDINWEDPHKR